MRDRHIGGVGDLHLILLYETAVLHIDVIYFYSVVISLCIGGDICHIFFLFHAEYLLLLSLNIAQNEAM